MSKFEQAPESIRRSELIDATLDCISELGIQATTLRAVAAKAGVTNGLIRHHFANKTNLIVAAYRRSTELAIASSIEVLSSRDGTPKERLSALIDAALSNPGASYRMLALWATFISQTPIDPLIAAARDESYANLRLLSKQLIFDLLEDEGRSCTPAEIENATVAVHAVLDGLWIAICLETDKTKVESIVNLGTEMIAKILSIKLPTGKSP
ncbi:TetR family transcriptional regulator C-terminal domain-containing protein [Paracoccaceae bacterium]